jgi:insulysin
LVQKIAISKQALEERPLVPEKILDNAAGVLWFLQDSYLPKGYIRFNILTPYFNDSPESKAKSLLYTACLEESLNEWSYDLHLAGINIECSRSNRGLQVDIEGFSEHSLKALKTLGEKLLHVSVKNVIYKSLKEDLVDDFLNTKQDSAYKQVSYELKAHLEKTTIHRDKIYNPPAVDCISDLEQVHYQKLAQTALQAFAIEAVVYGDYEKEDVLEAFVAFPKILKAQTLDSSLKPQNSNVVLESKTHQVFLIQEDVHNHCLGTVIQFGKRTPELVGITKLINSLSHSSFFTQLRTEQQLGYLVHSGLHYQEETLGMTFLIQSSDYTPALLKERIDAWKVSFFFFAEFGDNRLFMGFKFRKRAFFQLF